MKTIDIELPANGYPVYLGRGLLDECELARLGLALGVGDEALPDVVKLGGLAQRVVALGGERGFECGDARFERCDG